METATAKQRILDRAFLLAGLYGLEALTIGRLAADLDMSKAGVHGHFGSKQALQLATIQWAREQFRRDIIEPAEAVPDGVQRLWAMCTTLTAYSAETGLHGGDFWVTVANEYDSRSGQVRDAVEATMSSPRAIRPSSPSRSRRCSTRAATCTASITTRRRQSEPGPQYSGA
jgi:AcrR family transcriptional regulator